MPSGDACRACGGPLSARRSVAALGVAPVAALGVAPVAALAELAGRGGTIALLARRV